MPKVFDVAKFILEQTGEITAMKLQKLVYYSQVWTIVWDEKELFQEQVEAWANGAVVRELYDTHRGAFTVSHGSIPGGDSNNLSETEKENINKVVAFYGNYTAQQLSDINHQEAPWLDARGDLPPTARSNAVITKDAIHLYYSGIQKEE